MNFDFSSDQQILREHVRKFLGGACPPRSVRRVLEGEQAYAIEVWQQMGALGYLGAAIPERYGGIGLGHLELCVIAEEIGRSLAPIPFSSLAFATELIALGSDAHKSQWLPRLASGAVIACVGFFEPKKYCRPGQFACTYSAGRLNGIKSPVLDGGIADIAIILCRHGSHNGTSLAIVDLHSPEVRRETVVTIDPTRNHARLHFDSAPVELIESTGDAWRLFEVARNSAAILMAFEQLGGAERSLELARDYALQRHAFGRLIGSFQAIKHKLVDMYVKNTLARGHAYYGAWALSTNAAELPLAAAAARAAATDAFCYSAQESIQVHGGIGFTWEHDCHLFLKRARLLACALGDVHECKERIVTALQREQAAA